MSYEFLRCVSKPALLAGFLLLWACARSTSAQPQGQDLPVLAFYYSWYGENDWADPRMPDLPQQTYPYGDPAAIERHVLEGKAAGLDAFVMSWYGSEAGNPTDEHFHYLLVAAQKYDFKVALDFDIGANFSNSRERLVENLRFMYANYLNHPNYFTYDGRPVVFFWKQERFFSQAEWAEIRLEIDPDHTAIWIAEGVDPTWVNETFDGLHLYNIAWSPNPASTLNRFERGTRERGGIWVATAMPGWNDTGLADLRGSGAFAVRRGDGAYFRETFAAALETLPDMLVITSYNEWLEGSYLATSQQYGDRYVQLTRELIDDLQTSTPRPVLNPGATNVLAQPSVTLKIRSGPGQGYRAIGRVTSDEVLPVLAKYEDWLMINAEGVWGWINFGLAQTLGSMDTVPQTWWYAGAISRTPVADLLAPEIGWLIIASQANTLLWSYPDNALGEPLRVLDNGETLPITGVYRGYYRTPAGWVRADQVQLVDETDNPAPPELQASNQLIPDQDGVYVQAVGDLVLRQTPDGQRLVAFPFLAMASAVGISADGMWVQINYAGQIGWVARQFITPYGDLKGLPPAP